MHDRRLTLARPSASARIVACTLALALAMPVVANAREPVLLGAVAVAPANAAAVEVDVKLDQPDDAALADRIRGELVRTLNTEGVAVTKAAAEGVGTIQVSVRWNAEDNHELTAVVYVDGKGQPVEGSPWICDTCRDDQLLAKAAGIVPAVVPMLPARADDAAAPAEPPPSSDPPGDPPGDEPGSRKLGAMGKAGIGLAAGGGAALITGIVLVAALGKKTTVAEGDAQTIEETNYRPPGIALIGGGVALALTGVILIAVDRRRSRPTKAALVPVPGGLALTGRF